MQLSVHQFLHKEDEDSKPPSPSEALPHEGLNESPNVDSDHQILGLDDTNVDSDLQPLRLDDVDITASPNMVSDLRPSVSEGDASIGMESVPPDDSGTGGMDSSPTVLDKDDDDVSGSGPDLDSTLHWWEVLVVWCLNNDKSKELLDCVSMDCVSIDHASIFPHW